MKFKVGDRVIMSNPEGDYKKYKNFEGTIYGFGDDNTVRAKLSNKQGKMFNVTAIYSHELTKKRSTKAKVFKRK